MNFTIDRTDKIRFRRIPSANITGYKIYAKTYTTNEVYTELLIAEIENPKTAVPIKYTETLTKKADHIYYLPEYIYIDDSYPVKGYLDGTVINDNYITINATSKELTISQALSIPTSSVVTLDLYRDELEFSNTVSGKTEYRISVVADKPYMIGGHTIIY